MAQNAGHSQSSDSGGLDLKRPESLSNLEHFRGAVLSDRDIRLAVANGALTVWVEKDASESKPIAELQDDDFVVAVRDFNDVPPGCVESAGFALYAGAYSDGRTWKPLGSEFELRPGQSVLLRSRHFFKMSSGICALLFGLHRRQMAGVFVASGQIQPGWGNDQALPSPLYIKITNQGTESFKFDKETQIARLIFMYLTSLPVHESGTSESEVLRTTRSQQLRAQNRDRNFRLTVWGGLLSLAVVVLIFSPSDVLTKILLVLIGIFASLVVPVIGEFIPALKGPGK